MTDEITTETDPTDYTVRADQNSGARDLAPEPQTSSSASPVANEDKTPAAPAAGDAPDQPDEDPETFPREYVTKLRDESAKYRQRAQRADDLAHRLHGALVAATGRLADPADLAFDETHIDDEAALSAAIDDLLTRKPHLANRRPVGDVGQGATKPGDPVDLAGMLRARAS